MAQLEHTRHLLEMSRKGSQIIFEATNVVQDGSQADNDYLSPLTIDGFKYSSLQKVLCVSSSFTSRW